MESTTTAVAAPEGAPPKTGNLFDVLAHLLMTTRVSLEGSKHSSDPPRFVRIARINADDIPEEKETSIEKIATAGVEGLNATISNMIELALTAKKLFGKTDSLKALIEVVLALFKEGAKLSFTDEAAALFKFPSGRILPTEVDETLDKIEKYLDFIPAPEDLDRIGHELYRMACVVHKNGNGLDVELSGKVRVLQWSFGLGWDVTWDVGKSVKTLSVKHLGKRNLDLAHVPTKVDLEFKKVRLFSYAPTDGDEITDKTEIDNALDILGYEKSLDFIARIREFQFVNGLAVTGKLDVHTINRLYNLDFASKNLARALPRPSDLEIEWIKTGGYLELINGDADGYLDEGINLQTDRGGVPFYQLGAQYNTYSNRTAWVVDPPGMKYDVLPDYKFENLVHGFVGLQSREYNTKDRMFDPGPFSEGEASSGRFFFAARVVAPWEPGRAGHLAPTGDYLYGATDDDEKKVRAEPRFISRMYQDIDLATKHPTLLNQIPDGHQLVIYASSMRRACYNDRAYGKPDQGRVLINLIDGNNTPVIPSPYKDEWLPTAGFAASVENDKSKDQKNVWFLQKSLPLMIEKAGDGFKVGSVSLTSTNLKIRVTLEGRYMSGWDIDAYFDDVRVRWDYRKIAP